MRRSLRTPAAASHLSWRSRASMAGLSLGCLLSLVPTSAATESGSQILASFRTPVTEAELDDWLLHRGRGAPADRERALEEWILTRSLADEALRIGLDREPAVRVELALKEAALARPLLQRQLTEAIQVTSEEVEAKYQAIKDSYARPRRVRLRNLFKRYPPNADADARAAVHRQMETIRRRLLSGEAFAELAESESQSQTRLRGGLIGNVRAGTLSPEVDAVAMAMEAGEISEILEGPGGLTILYCEEVLEPVVRTARELREIARRLLESKAFREASSRFDEHLLETAAPVYHWRRRLSGGLSAVFVEYSGGTLTAAEVRSLVSGPRSTTALSELSDGQIVEAVEGFVRAQARLREVHLRGLADADFGARRRATRRQVLASKALAHLVEERLIPPTLEEIEALYRSRPEDFVRPRHYRLGVIALPLAPEDLRRSYRSGELLLHRIESGELSFAEAARRHSVDPSAAGGGDVGWVSRWAVPRRFGIDFLRALLRLSRGERSDLVEDQGRLWILELRELEEKRPMTFEEARTAAENRLGSERVRALEAELTAEWLSSLEIEHTPDG